MSVPLLDLTRQYATIQDEVEATVLAVMRSGRYILGPEVAALEQELADYVGSKHAIGMSSGTDALLAALMALGVGPGDRVVMPVYSFFATAGTVARLGAVPVFVDIEPTWCNMDVAALREALDRDPRIKAAIFVHLFGAASGIEAVAELLAARGIPLIEDAAQAIGSKSRGVMAGTFGSIACFSTFPSKTLGGPGDGGFAVTGDDQVATAMRRARNHGQSDAYRHETVGGNFRMDELQGAVLRVKLRHLEEWIAGRRRNAELYRERFARALPKNALRLPTDVADRHGYHQLVVRVDAAQRDPLLAALRERSIGCAVYYPLPFHQQPCFANLGYRAGQFPVAEEASRTTLALPVFPELRSEEIDEVVGAVSAALGG
jgi:dTDP-4-amino-4,6-dideoxygalactose transaminase